MGSPPRALTILTSLAIIGFVLWAWLPNDDVTPLSTSTPAVATGDDHAVIATDALAKGSVQTAAAARSDATPTQEATAAKETTPPPTTGTVLVEVYRAPNIPMPDVQVGMHAQSTGSTGPDGKVRLTGKPGRWLVKIVPGSLPAGMLAPIQQNTTYDRYEIPGFYGREVVIEAGVEAHLRLRVFVPAEVTGLVVDRTGQPVADCQVRLKCLQPELGGIAFDATTASDGTFRFLNIPPQRYKLNAHPATSSHAPPPSRLEIAEGERSALPPIELDRGNCVLRGRVVDQDGAAFANVPVIVFPDDYSPTNNEVPSTLADAVATATTAADGTFACERVPAIPVTVQAYPEGTQLAIGRPNRLRHPIPPKQARLSPYSVIDLGQFVGERCRTFQLEVTLDVDKQRCPRKPGAFVVSESNLRDEQAWTRLPEKDGKHAWSCETPHQAIYVIVRHRNFPTAQRRVEVTPDHTESITIQFP